MADFKTAEQYVVDRLESTERELEELKITHATEVGRHVHEFEEMRARLEDAYELLDMLRDFVNVRLDSYFGYCICVDTIYGKENPEAVARLMEYYDMRVQEDDNDE